MDQNQFQVLSRPSQGLEIQGFSRVFKTHTNPKESRSLIILFYLAGIPACSLDKQHSNFAFYLVGIPACPRTTDK